MHGDRLRAREIRERHIDQDSLPAGLSLSRRQDAVDDDSFDGRVGLSATSK
jgi:hypothetical protein